MRSAPANISLMRGVSSSSVGASAVIAGVMPWIFSVLFHLRVCVGRTRVFIIMLPFASQMLIEIISSRS